MQSLAVCLFLSGCAVASDAGPGVPCSEFEGPERQATAAVRHFLKLVKTSRMEDAARLTGVPCDFMMFAATDRKQLPGGLAKGRAVLRELAAFLPDPVEAPAWGTIRDQKPWRAQQSRIDAVLRPSDYYVRLGFDGRACPAAFLVRMDAGGPVIVGLADD
jgi:hypothetical protein